MPSRIVFVVLLLTFIIPGTRAESGLTPIIVAAVVSVLLLGVISLLIGLLYYWRHSINTIDRNVGMKQRLKRAKKKRALSQQSIIANEKRQGVTTYSRPPSRPPSEHSTRMRPYREPSEHSLHMYPAPNFSEKANAWIQEHPQNTHDVKEKVMNFGDEEEDVIITEVIGNATVTQAPAQPPATSGVISFTREVEDTPEQQQLNLLLRRQTDLAESGVGQATMNTDEDVAVVDFTNNNNVDDTTVLY